MPEGWRSMRLDEIEPTPIVDGTLLWRPVRRTLDVGAFGINAYAAPNAGDVVVEEHTESTLGHEEVYGEELFAAERHRAAGDYDAYAAELAAVLEHRPDDPATLYNLACAEALAGRPEAALPRLRRALEARPEWAERARRDGDLATARELPGWPG